MGTPPSSYRARQAAEMLGISPAATLWRWVKNIEGFPRPRRLGYAALFLTVQSCWRGATHTSWRPATAPRNNRQGYAHHAKQLPSAFVATAGQREAPLPVFRGTSVYAIPALAAARAYRAS